MNWLMYIGGGIIWLGLWASIYALYIYFMFKALQNSSFLSIIFYRFGFGYVGGFKC